MCLTVQFCQPQFLKRMILLQCMFFGIFVKIGDCCWVHLFLGLLFSSTDLRIYFWPMYCRVCHYTLEARPWDLVQCSFCPELLRLFLGLLCFPAHPKIVFSVSLKNVVGVLTGLLWICELLSLMSHFSGYRFCRSRSA